MEEISLCRVRLFATLWKVPYQVAPSMGFSRQEYWSGLPFPSPGVFIDYMILNTENPKESIHKKLFKMSTSKLQDTKLIYET